MIRRRLAAAILTVGLLFGGCGPVWVGPTRVDTWGGVGNAYVCIDLPADSVEDAARAVSTWDRALRQWRRLVPVIGADDGCSYVISETSTPHPTDPAAVGWASRIGGRRIQLLRGRYETDVEVIVLHEMGHALGAQHVDGTLMNPTYDTITLRCPDVVTVSQVAAYNGLDMATLSWCQD